MMAQLVEKDVEAYLQSQLGSGLSIQSMKQTFPGASRETWLVFARNAGVEEGLVVRIDPPEGSCVPTTMRREFAIYSKLYKTEIPVAEPLWYDESVEFAGGRPHMIRRLVDGSTSVPGLTGNTAKAAEVRRSTAFEVMEKLALLHRLDWRPLGLGEILDVPADPSSALKDDFETWRGLWNQDRTEADPVLSEALSWLDEQAPTDTPWLMLVKGNNGVGEEIFRDGRIVAMSDWELASLGDGALDLAFSQGTMLLTDFDDTLKHYEACVGQPVSPERLAFSGFLVWLKQIVCLRSNMLRLYREGKSDRIFGMSMGVVYAETARTRLARCIGRNIVDVWRETVSEEVSMYAHLGGA
jgi:aminoglycoside phosphotransferase (APT) family kinase protein